MKAVAILGEPAVGKSTLMRNIIKSFSGGKKMKYKKCKFTFFTHENFIILGDYFTDKPFEGTDLLAMDAINDTERLLLAMKAKHPRLKVLFEGDRLTNARFLNMLNANYDLKMIRLTCDAHIKEMRHESRKDTQTPQFKKSRKTKLDNLCEKFKIEELDTTKLDDGQVFRQFMRESGLLGEVFKIGRD